MPFRKKPLNSNSNNNTIFIKIDGQEMCATMLRFQLQVCIIRWSNQKLKVVTNFPGSYNSPCQLTSYIILVHRTSWRPKYENQEALGKGTPRTQDLKS